MWDKEPNSDLVTIARFIYPYQAELLVGKLSSEGIQAYVRGIDHVITDPFISTALGGIRVEVLASDETEALRILHSIESEPINMENEGRVIEINRTRYDEVPGTCPACKEESVFVARSKQNIDEYTEQVHQQLNVPVPIDHNYFCLSCNHHWKV